jgi:hypothetical protein
MEYTSVSDPNMLNVVRKIWDAIIGDGIKTDDFKYTNKKIGFDYDKNHFRKSVNRIEGVKFCPYCGNENCKTLVIIQPVYDVMGIPIEADGEYIRLIKNKMVAEFFKADIMLSSFSFAASSNSTLTDYFAEQSYKKIDDEQYKKFLEFIYILLKSLKRMENKNFIKELRKHGILVLEN